MIHLKIQNNSGQAYGTVVATGYVAEAAARHVGVSRTGVTNLLAKQFADYNDSWSTSSRAKIITMTIAITMTESLL